MSLQGSVKPGYIVTGRVTAIDYILMTAYGIALKNGFVGTEQEWLESLDGTRVSTEQIMVSLRQYFDEYPVQDGIVGIDGTTFTPNVDSDGNLSWTNDGGLKNPEPVNIKGDKGADGKDGVDGTDGEDGYTPVKGTDYFTDADKEELVDDIVNETFGINTTALDFSNWDNGSFKETLSDGTTVTHAVTYDSNGVITIMGDIAVSGVNA